MWHLLEIIHQHLHLEKSQIDTHTKEGRVSAMFSVCLWLEISHQKNSQWTWFQTIDLLKLWSRKLGIVKRLVKSPQKKKTPFCIVLVHYGPFPQEVNEKSVKLAVWAVSLNFLHDFTLFVVDIHQIRLISLFRHFPDHFHFHGSAGLIPKVNLSLRLKYIWIWRVALCHRSSFNLWCDVHGILFLKTS